MRRWIWASVVALCGACSGASSSDGAAGAGGGGQQQASVVHGLRVSEVSIYQGVKVGLMLEGQPVGARTAPVVQGRDALLRVFVAPEPDWQPREVAVRLELERGGAALPPQEIRRFVQGPSAEADFMSAFNFDIAGVELTGDLAWRVGIYEVGPSTGAPTPGAVYPAAGSEALAALSSGPSIKVVLVPIQYNADGSGRLPDTSPSQIQRLQEHMYRTYPVASVDLVVRDAPMQWNYTVSPWGDGWGELLQQLMYARDQDNPGVNVYYYGAFQPSQSFYQYCQQGCVAGLSAGGVGPGDDWARASLGVLYDGEYSAGTFIHEVGHAHGREHAPCAPGGQIQSVDPAYPYPNAFLGVWGYDLVDHELIEPSGARDFMSYCDPTWVSDYTFNGLFERIALLNGAAAFSGAPQAYRLLSLDGSGELRAGPRIELRTPPSGPARTVALLGAAGEPLGETQARYHAYTHIPGGILLVPEPDAAVHRVAVGGRAVVLERD